MTFNAALTQLLDQEGGYTLVNLNDGAGDTVCGITRNNFPNWGGWQLVDTGDRDSSALKALVAGFYATEFWHPLQCDQLQEVITGTLFSFAVNAGVGTAAKALQRALSVTEDGQIGGVTIGACRAADPAKLYRMLIAEQLSHYTKCSTWATFGKGWVNRVISELRGC